MKSKLKILALVLLLGIALFVRIYKISEYMQFQGDEGRDALVLWRMAVEKRPTLIGPGTSIGNMYNGPLYYYLILPSFIIAGNSPVGPSLFVALLSVITVYLIYIFSGRMFSPRVGATAAVLYALSPTVIIYSRSSWNPNVMPFFALVSIWCLWMITRSAQRRWYLLLGVSLAFAIQSHYLGLLLLPTVGIWLTIHFIKSTPTARKFIIKSSVMLMFILGILMSPILIFDFRHNFINSKAMYLFFTQRQTTVNFKVYKALPQMIPIFIQVSTKLLSSSVEKLGQIISLVLALSSILLIRQNRKNTALLIIMTWIFLGLVGLGLYKQTIYDHYYGFFFPAFFILFGLVVDYFWPKNLLYRVVSTLSVMALVYVMILNNPLWSAPNNLYQHTVAVSEKIISESASQSFNLGMIAKQNYDSGYRFVLTREGAPPKDAPQNVTEQLFVVCEDKITDCKPVGHPKAEIANFGMAKEDGFWYFSWGTTLFKLVHNQPQK